MIDWMVMIYFTMSGAMLALAATGLVIAAVMPGADRWNRRFFMGLFATIMLCMASLLIDCLVWENPNMTTVSRIAIYFEYFLLSLPLPMFTAFLLYTSGERWQSSRLFRAAIVLWSIYFILLGIAQRTTIMYYITSDNHFCRGAWHPMLMAPIIIIMLFNLASVIRRRGKLSPKHCAAFLIYLIPLTATWIIHTFVFVPLLVFIGVVISTLSMFAIILYDQIDRYLRQQREIAHQRASIMVLEMRPHFIYNAMMSIYYLCAQDAKKAQQVTLDFTTYLRKNFTAIASENTVPFSDELEHTRAYLAVEQVQFEDGLFVDYDTPHKEFRVPPLTLQPIVENAVKHGMDPESAPLHISIRTRATETGSEIVVEDDGQGWPSAGAGAPKGTNLRVAGRAGFAPADGPGFATRSEAEPVPVETPAPHIALENIRQRLSMMCGGKLTIRPREGGGTVVTVTIP